MKRNDKIETRADFSAIRYGMCWEDADILLEALELRPGDSCLSIASAGDNTLALLAKSPSRVVALDLSRAQLACLELRVAAFRALDHPELLELVGLAPSTSRPALYQRCREHLSEEARLFWDAHPDEIAGGIGRSGKFERYLATFRRFVLPLIHSGVLIEALMTPRTREERESFYTKKWDTRFWRVLFSLFFSRFLMGRMGRDPRFFDHVEGKVADRIRSRARHALTALDPGQNPYLQMILLEDTPLVLPYAFRPENFDRIRDNLDALEIRCTAIEDYLAEQPSDTFDAYNVSDLFEYIPEAAYHRTLAQIVRTGTPGARVAYWNLFVPRRRPQSMAHLLRPFASTGQGILLLGLCRRGNRRKLAQTHERT